MTVSLVKVRLSHGTTEAVSGSDVLIKSGCLLGHFCDFLSPFAWSLLPGISSLSVPLLCDWSS